MNLRSFIFGTAAVFATAMPALAGDLSISEPVETVKICDTFGVGFWYIPGSDSCLKIAGYVRFDTRVTDTPIVASGHSSYWDFRTRARLNITASSVTDFGVLTGFMRLQGDYDPTKSTSGNLLLDRANLSIGPILAGTDTSAFDHPAGGYNLDTSALRSDLVTSHIQWTGKSGPFSTVLSLEDPRFRNGTGANNGKWPDFVAALGYSEGPLDTRIAGAIVDQYLGSAGFAVQVGATLKLDQIAKGDGVRFIAAYASDAGSFTGASKALGSTYAGGTSWNVVGTAQHFWASNFSTAVLGSYVTATNGTSAYAYNAAISANWVPYKEFSVGAELAYNYNTTKSDPDSVIGLLRLVRDFQ